MEDVSELLNSILEDYRKMTDRLKDLSARVYEVEVENQNLMRLLGVSSSPDIFSDDDFDLDPYEEYDRY